MAAALARYRPVNRRIAPDALEGCPAMRRTLVLATLFLLAFAAPAAARDTVVRSFDGTELHVSFHPAKEGKRAPTILMTHGWGGQRERSPDGPSSAANAGHGRAAEGRLQRPHLGLARLRRLRRHRHHRLPQERGARRPRAAELARAPARGQARPQARPARRHARRLVRGRDPVRRRRDRPPDRRDRPQHRLALAGHLALPRGDDQGRLVERCSTPPGRPGGWTRTSRRRSPPARPAATCRPRTGRGSPRAGRARWSSASRCRR